MAPYILDLVISLIGICCGIPPYHEGRATAAAPLHLTGPAASFQAWASLLAGVVFLSAAIWMIVRLAMKLL
jgi:hypothetical protein